MGKIPRILLGITIALILVLHYTWLGWLFPGTSLVAMFVAPVVLMISLGAGGGAYAIFASIKSKWKIAFLSSVIIISVMLLQFFTYPTAREELPEQIRDYCVAFLKYPNDTKYTDLLNIFSKPPDRIAAMVKYLDKIPDRVLVIETMGTRDGKLMRLERYYITYQDDHIGYDTSKLQVLDAGLETKVVVNPNGPDRKEYYISGNLTYWFEGVLSGETGGGEQNGSTVLYYCEDFKEDWTLRTGAAKVFTFILRHFR